MSLHCALFSIEYACAKSWLDSGLEVTTMLGHSFGQLVALCVAGSFSLVDGLRLISERSRLIRDIWGPESGAMLSVECDQQTLEILLQKSEQLYGPGSAEIACYNGPRSFVVAGPTKDLAAVEITAESAMSGMELRLGKLKVTHAFHSALTDPILPTLSSVAQSISFKKPEISVETCSPGSNCSYIDADSLVKHTRMPVHFSDAVHRVQSRLGSAIWLDAGCGRAIIQMTQKALGSSNESAHTFRSLDLTTSDAQSNLAKVTSELWLLGSAVQFWHFHKIQKESYLPIHLPPYEFAKTSHWIQHKPIIGPVESSSEPVEEHHDLLRQLRPDSDPSPLFLIDTANEVFTFLANGHAVLDQCLCPASLYVEVAVRAAMGIAKNEASTALPHLQSLSMSSPLGLSLSKRVYLQMHSDSSKEGSWQFSLFSQNSDTNEDRTAHASGTVKLLPSDDATTCRHFSSLKRLVNPSRCERIWKSPNASGLSGIVVYENFARVVNYAGYYQGVCGVFAEDREAVGHIAMPKESPASMKECLCNPIAIDNFLQVAGIHVNCLTGCAASDVYLCTAIDELSISSMFTAREAGSRSWTVYSNFEATSETAVTNDVFALDPDSGEVLAALMGARFRRVPLLSLSKALAKLNNEGRKGSSVGANITSLGAKASASRDSFDLKADLHSEEVVTRRDQRSKPSGETQPARDITFENVQGILSGIIEVPSDEIRLESTLLDLGVDSLLITEVAGEIKKVFGLNLANEELGSLERVGDIVRLLRSSVPVQSPCIQKASGSTLTAKNNPVLGPQDLVLCKEAECDTTQRPNESIALIAHAEFKDTRFQYDTVAKASGFLGFCSEVYPSQARLVVAYVVEAFRDLGCDLSVLDKGSKLPLVQTQPKHGKVMRQLFRILEDSGFIISKDKAREGFFLRTDKAVPLESAEAIKSALVERFPKHKSEHELLCTTGPRLADCLTGHTDPLSLIFSNGSVRKLLEDVYANAPMFKTGSILLGQYLSGVIRNTGRNREIQVLELGAGTGGTTSFLIQAFVKCEQQFRYTFTDISPSLVAAAKKRFAQHDFMEYAVRDIEEAPSSEFLGRYDIVISTNCIHATRDLTQSCANIRRVLQPEGILCLIELTQHLFWFDLVFGLLEGWWLFTDGREHVLASEGRWEACLRRAGYHWVDWSQGKSEESRILRLIVASPSATLPRDQERESVFESREADTITKESVVMKEEGETELVADIYYPPEAERDDASPRPIGKSGHDRVSHFATPYHRSKWRSLTLVVQLS